MKLWLLFTFAVATLICGDLRFAHAQGHTRVDAEARRVYFVPIGDTPAFWVDTLIVQCRRKLNLSVDTLPRLSSDRVWVDPERGQVVAERVMNWTQWVRSFLPCRAVPQLSRLADDHDMDRKLETVTRDDICREKA
jgi:hypothetical protein